MVQIIPAIDVATEEEYKETLKKIEDSRVFEDGWVHIDFADNIFAPWKTITPDILKKYPTKLKIEVHLMTRDPWVWVDDFDYRGSTVRRVIVHVELPEGELRRFDEEVEHMNGTGLALNPETQVQKVRPFVAKIDTVLIMSVHPGKQGQEFMPDVLEKIKQLKGMGDFLIGVDGGITPENAKMIVDAGADYLVVGSHLIEGNIDENLEKFWEILQES